jgi:hypothetical protein
MVQRFAPLVKRQVDFWQYQVDKFGPEHPRYRPEKIERYKQLVNDFGQLLAHLIEQEGEPPAYRPPASTRRLPGWWNKRGSSSETPKPDSSHLPEPAAAPAPPLDDLADLPAELLAELSEGAKGEKDVLVKIIDERGGTATLDEVLIDLFRKHREIGKRNIVANKLYRLNKRKLVWPVPGKKGIYTTTKPPEVNGGKDSPNESEEGPDGMSEPSLDDLGVAGSQEGPSKPSPVGSTPTASTLARQKLLSGTASLPVAEFPHFGRRPTTK